jgi:hypothetical protein
VSGLRRHPFGQAKSMFSALPKATFAFIHRAPFRQPPLKKLTLIPMKDALKQLKTAYQQSNKGKYPNVPDHGRQAVKLSHSTANGLTKAILIWVKLNGHKARRQPSEGQMQAREAIHGRPGTSKQLPGK